MTGQPSITVTVAFAAAYEQVVIEVTLRSGSTIGDAIARSGICARFPEIDLVAVKAGIWGKVRDLKYELRDGDRVEIYRPLKADPKEARRARAGKTRSN
jgi:uncharacterized protein